MNDYTRRCYRGIIAGRGFKSRRLHFYADLNLIQVGFLLSAGKSVGQAVPDIVQRDVIHWIASTKGPGLYRGRPFGSENWQNRTAKRLGLQSTKRPRGRPRSSQSTMSTMSVPLMLLADAPRRSFDRGKLPKREVGGSEIRFSPNGARSLGVPFHFSFCRVFQLLYPLSYRFLYTYRISTGSMP